MMIDVTPIAKGNVPLHFQSDITKFTSPNCKDYSDYGFE